MSEEKAYGWGEKRDAIGAAAEKILRKELVGLGGLSATIPLNELREKIKDLFTHTSISSLEVVNALRKNPRTGYVCAGQEEAGIMYGEEIVTIYNLVAKALGLSLLPEFEDVMLKAA